jgi:hypothetical protein
MVQCKLNIQRYINKINAIDIIDYQRLEVVLHDWHIIKSGTRKLTMPSAILYSTMAELVGICRAKRIENFGGGN